MILDNTRHISIGGKSVARLEIGGGVLWKCLPGGYTRVDYIETTGTQYVDAEFVPNQDTRVVCEFMLQSTSGFQSVYGARRSVANNDFSLRLSSKRWQPIYNTTYGTFTTVPVDTEKWHIADQNKNVFTFDGVVEAEFEYADFTAPTTLNIARINAGNGSHTYCSGRYRECRIYDNGVLVRYFIPCKDADGNIGMYDTVNDKFYGNVGEGEFIAGPELPRLPLGFRQLEYIEFTGSQLVDSEFTPNQDTRVVCEFMFRGANSNGSRDIYGVRQSISSGLYWLRVISSCWQPAYDNTLGSTEIAADTTEWHIADQNKNIFSIDGVEAYRFEYSEFTCPLSLYLGGGQSPYNGYTRYYGKARYRSFKIYDNGVLVRDFVPCKSRDGQIGMYDTVNDRFHGNVGTDEFVAGSEETN